VKVEISGHMTIRPHLLTQQLSSHVLPLIFAVLRTVHRPKGKSI